MNTITDNEFGTVIVVRRRNSRYIRLRVNHDGSLQASVPLRAALHNVKSLIDTSRDALRKVVAERQSQATMYTDNMIIGKSHKLQISVGPSYPQVKARISGLKIIVLSPSLDQLKLSTSIAIIKKTVIRALKREAKSYLPGRVEYLAEMHGLTIKKIGFNNAQTRWGSCSAIGTITLNVALMQLPHELIDYVILHELSHTRHMNHTPAFWDLVGTLCPEYPKFRKQLKSYHPFI